MKRILSVRRVTCGIAAAALVVVAAVGIADGYTTAGTGQAPAPVSGP